MVLDVVEECPGGFGGVGAGGVDALASFFEGSSRPCPGGVGEVVHDGRDGVEAVVDVSQKLDQLQMLELSVVVASTAVGAASGFNDASGFPVPDGGGVDAERGGGLADADGVAAGYP